MSGEGNISISATPARAVGIFYAFLRRRHSTRL